MDNNCTILVVGSSNTDMVVLTEHFPIPGETILGGSFFMNPGGKGANQAVAAARLGGKVAFIGKVGNDIFGRETRENLSREGIDVSGLSIDPDHPSGVAQIMVDKNGENCIVVAGGANNFLMPTDVEKNQPLLRQATVVLMQMEVPMETILHVADSGKKGKKKIILNPAPAQSLSDTLYASLYAITPNESEAAQLTGVQVKDEKSAALAAGFFHRKGVPVVVITLGASGAYLSSDSFNGIIPTPRVKAVDTTAAGDTFNGALAVGISMDMDLVEAVKFANKAAAISVTRAGAQSSVPHLSETETFN
ncbi:MAG: ribokinase [Cyclobacteriaceae bacterium]